MVRFEKATRKVIIDLFLIESNDPAKPSIMFDKDNNTVVFRPCLGTKVSAFVGPKGITFVLAEEKGKFLMALNKESRVTYDWSGIKWATENPEGSATYERMRITVNAGKQAKGKAIQVTGNSFPLIIGGKPSVWNNFTPKSSPMYLRSTDLSPSCTSLVNICEQEGDEYESLSSDALYGLSSEIGLDPGTESAADYSEREPVEPPSVENEDSQTPPQTPNSPKTPATVQRHKVEVGDTPLLRNPLVSDKSCSKTNPKLNEGPQAPTGNIPKKELEKKASASNSRASSRARSSSSSKHGSRSGSNTSLPRNSNRSEEPCKRISKSLNKVIDTYKDGLKTHIAEIRSSKRALDVNMTISGKEKKKKNRSPIKPFRRKSGPEISSDMTMKVRDEIYSNLTYSKLYDGHLLNAGIKEDEDARALGVSEDGKNLHAYLGKPKFDFVAGTLYIYVQAKDKGELENRIDSKKPKRQLKVSGEMIKALLLYVNDLHDPTKAEAALQSLHNTTGSVLQIQKLSDPNNKQVHIADIPIDLFVNQIQLLNNKEHIQTKYKRIEKSGGFGHKSLAAMDSKHLLSSKLAQATTPEELKTECYETLTRIFGESVMELIQKIQGQKLSMHSCVTTLQQIVIKVDTILSQDTSLDEKKTFLITLFGYEAPDLVRSNDIVAQHTMVALANDITQHFELFTQRESRVLAACEYQSEKFYDLIRRIVDAHVAGPRNNSVSPDMQKELKLAADELGKIRSSEAVKMMSGGIRDSVNPVSLQKISLKKEFKKNVLTEYQRSQNVKPGGNLTMAKPVLPSNDTPVLPGNLKSYLEYAFDDNKQEEMQEKMIQLIKDNPSKSDKAYKLLFQEKYDPMD